MYDIILNSLAKEGITAVISSQRATYRNLTCAGIKYLKDNRYFLATSYYTDTWISASPLGPIVDTDGHVLCEDILDMATVQEVQDLNALRCYPFTDERTLAHLYGVLDAHAERYARDALRDYGALIHRCVFMLIPVPQVLVSFAKDKKFLGTISLNFRGGVDLITKATSLIEKITSQIAVKELPSMEVIEHG